jgi:hypothetical protein
MVRNKLKILPHLSKRKVVSLRIKQVKQCNKLKEKCKIRLKI